MFVEFAVEPAIFGSRSNLTQYLPHLRPACGRLVGSAPSSWICDVEHAIQNLSLSPLERSVADEYLRETYSGLSERVGMRWSAAKNWLENVIEEDRRRPFHGIIAESESDCPKALKAGCLHGMDSVWERSATQRIPKRCNDLTTCVAPLLKISNTILIIDPYFNSFKKGFVEAALAVIAGACSRRSLAPPTVHLYASLRIGGKVRDKEGFHSKTQSEFAPRLPVGVKVQLYLLAPKPDGDEFHDRYIVTEKGGILITYGIDNNPNRHITTHIARLATCDIRAVFRDFYSAPTRKYDVLSGFPRSIERASPAAPGRQAAAGRT